MAFLESTWDGASSLPPLEPKQNKTKKLKKKKKTTKLEAKRVTYIIFCKV